MSEVRERPGPHPAAGLWAWTQARALQSVAGLVFAVVALALVGAEYLYKQSAEDGHGGLFGYYALAGIGAYVTLWLASWILRGMLTRPADYYAAKGEGGDG